MNNHQRESQYEHQRREQQQFATPYIYIYIYIYYLLIRESSKSNINYMLQYLTNIEAYYTRTLECSRNFYTSTHNVYSKLITK